MYIQLISERLTSTARSVRRMERILDDLTAYSQRTAQRGILLFPAQVHLDQIVDSVLDEFSAELSKHRVTVEIPDGLPRLWADENRLAQVLANLISNAAKYTPVDAALSVTARLVEGPDGHVLLTVRDTGPGIPEEEYPHVFKRFYRSLRDRDKKGTGLGLYLCRQICKAHGGDMWLDRVPGMSISSTWHIVPEPAAEHPKNPPPLPQQPDPFKLSQAILDYRRTYNLSRTELARQTGVSESTLRNLEAGLTEASPKTLARLRRVLVGSRRPR